MTDAAKRWRKEGARALCDVELDRLLQEYGAVRVAKKLPPGERGEVLLLISPPFVAQAKPPVVPVTVLDGSLFHLLEMTYGDIRTAAREAGCSGDQLTIYGK